MAIHPAVRIAFIDQQTSIHSVVVDGIWKEVDSVECVVDGGWKTIDELYVQTNNSWKEVS